MKTNWKKKLKTVLGKDEFSEQSTNSALTKADKSQLRQVSSAFVSDKLRHFPENSKPNFELGKDDFSDLPTVSEPTKTDETPSNTLLSAFVSGQLVGCSKNYDESAEIKTDYFHQILNQFIEAGVKFDVSADSFLVFSHKGRLSPSDEDFLVLNGAEVLCHLQQSLLMKHLFNHSPEQFEDFAFEIREREAIFSENCLNSPLRITAKTPLEIYCEAVKDVTKKWFVDLLERKT